MTKRELGRTLVAEALGSALLLATVVGSGIMGEQLAGGNQAIALLGNTLATGAILAVLILVLGPVSGAHFNPAVTLAFLIRGEIPRGLAGAYTIVQIVGALFGVLVAHAMFSQELIQSSTQTRGSPGTWLAEVVATFGLVLTVLGCQRFRRDATPWAVGLFIAAGYWFTSSTSFANPAVTLARACTDSFSGIAPSDIPAFVVAELAGAAGGALLAPWLFGESRATAR